MSQQASHTTTITSSCDHCEKSLVWSVEGIAESMPTPDGWLTFYLSYPDQPREPKGWRLYCTEACAIDGFVTTLRSVYPPHTQTSTADPLSFLSSRG